MNKLPSNIAMFAEQTGGTADFYKKAVDYYNHYSDKTLGKKIGSYDDTVSLAAKEDQIYQCLCKEVGRISGQDMNAFNIRVMSNNPVVNWAMANIANHIVDAIIPYTIIESTGAYMEMGHVDWGGTASYDIEPNFLFTVSQGAQAQRTSFVQKQFRTTRTLTPINHAITVQASLYKVLCQQESLGDFIRKAVLSVETAMTVDAYEAFRAGLNAATIPTALTKTGYTQESLLELLMTVEAYNHGAKPTILGTALAIEKILPNGADGYRITTPSEAMSIQLIRNFFNYDIIVLPQVATGTPDYGLALNNTELYIVSTNSQKLLKGNNMEMNRQYYAPLVA